MRSDDTESTHLGARPRVSVYIAVSLDGFIAEVGGGLGVLDGLRGDGTEDHGYAAFMATIDALVLGRTTYDQVLGFGEWPFTGKSVVVLTHRPLTPTHGERAHAGALAPLLAELAANGCRRVYLDGGVAVRTGLAEDVVDDLTLSTVPVLLGRGVPLFGPDVPRRDFTPVSTQLFSTGLVQTRYDRRR